MLKPAADQFSLLTVSHLANTSANLTSSLYNFLIISIEEWQNKTSNFNIYEIQEFPTL